MIGQTLLHYRVVDRLGAGGMGVVYRAEDTLLGRSVAIKVLPAELTRDDEAKQRFMHEARAASALDHPNICTIHEINEAPDGQLFLVMACYEGETLAARLKRGPVSIAEALDIATQTAHGLARAHAAGVVHRDIKPANLFLTSDGLVKILDFGIAKLHDQTRVTRTGQTYGTLAYMSPEQMGGGEVTAASDVWSLGVVLYEMLAGRRPFTAGHELAVMDAVRSDEPPALTQFQPDVPRELARIVARTLQKRPQGRYHGAEDLAKDLEALKKSLDTPATGTRTVAEALRNPRVAIPAALVVVAAVVWGAWLVKRNADVRWARERAVPEILGHADAAEYVTAFQLAERAERYIPDDAMLATVWPRVSASGSIVTSPPGAAVFMKPYGAPDTEWKPLGTTPLKGVRLPRGALEWRIEKEGYATLLLASPNPGVMLQNLASLPPMTFPLMRTEDLPSEMVFVPGGAYPVRLSGFNTRDNLELDPFLIDRDEVTNAAFKQFVDAGGYRNHEVWSSQPFVKDGRELSREEAAALFVDSTGRPGPSTWELGSYPTGKGDYPVAGISWYEAVAYCGYRGKQLPTIFHWARAAMSPGEHLSALAPAILKTSNFGSGGPMAVGRAGRGPYGTFDTAGNVREWAWNTTGGGRWALGGAWNDPVYMFSVRAATPPFDRSPVNGFRCVKYLGPSPSGELTAPVEVAFDYRKAKPVSDEVFEIFRRQYAYARGTLNARVESRETRSGAWTKEAVTLDAGYRNERLTVYLFLPVNGKPPYGAVIYFGGLGNFQTKSSSKNAIPFGADFILQSGRAIIWPVYKGSFERWDRFLDLAGEESLRAMRERMVEWRWDLGRAIDYLQSRPDIDATRLAYVGGSFGASMPLPLLALEDRIRAAVLVTGGFPYRGNPAEADAINYVPRITIPVLMLNGRYDYVFPVETAQKPLFDLLGTPPADKRHVLFEAAHGSSLPRGQMIKETLDWLDRFAQ